MPDPISGGPGATSAAPATTAPAAAPAATTVDPTIAKVVLGGKTYEVPSELADAVRRERDRVAGEFGSRLQTYERQLAELRDSVETRPAPEDETPRPPNPRDLIDDPEKYHRDSLQYTQWLVDTRTAGVEQRRLEEQQIARTEAQRNAAWNTEVAKFFTANPELRGEEDIVDTVWRVNFNRLKDLPVEEGFSELAKLSRERILGAAEKGKQLASRKTVTLETSANSRRQPAASRDEEPTEPIRGGLQAAIRAKQRRFRAPAVEAAQT